MTLSPAKIRCRSDSDSEGESGSAIAGHTLVQVLVLIMVLALIQLALVLHTRNILIDAASQGARRAALVGATPEEGRTRTGELVSAALSDSLVETVNLRILPGTGEWQGYQMVEVEIVATLPLIGLLGPPRSLTVRGHALLEEAG